MHVLLRHSSIPAKTDAIASGRLAKGKVVLKNNYILVLSQRKKSLLGWLLWHLHNVMSLNYQKGLPSVGEIS